MAEEQNEQKFAQEMWQAYEPIYNAQGIDIKIITPDVRSNVYYVKRPRIVEEIVYAKDEEGNLLVEKDEYGKTMRDKNGSIIYKTKGVQLVEQGQEIVRKELAVPNIATTNRVTSNLEWYDIIFNEWNDYQDSYLGIMQERFGIDLSKQLYRHNTLRISNETNSKAKNQTTVQAIKTFITKSEGKKFIENVDQTFQSTKPMAHGKSLMEMAQNEGKTLW